MDGLNYPNSPVAACKGKRRLCESLKFKSTREPQTLIDTHLITHIYTHTHLH